MKLTHSKWGLITVLLLAVGLVGGCKKKKNDDDDDDDDPTSVSGGGGGGGSGAGTLKGLFPTSLAVASPYAKKGAGLTLQDGSSDDFNAKQEETSAILNGTTAAACAYKLSVQVLGGNPNCYGPSIDYQSHPDWVSGSGQDGMLPGGDLGIWDATADGGEACIAAKMNYEIGRGAAFADAGINTVAMMLCAANVAGQALPAAGETVDMTATVSGVLTGQEIGGTVTAASITNDGTGIYTSSITLDGTTGTSKVSVKHKALDEANATYQGKLWMSYVPKSGPSTQTEAISIVYNKNSAEELKLELRQSRFASSDEAVLFDAAKNANPPLNNDGYSWGLFDLNPANGTGKVAYGWVAGTKMENMRSFIAEVSADADGVKSGCGYFGFGASLQDVLADDDRSGWLDRMICNWAGPSNSHAGIASVQRQCMSQSSGAFAPTSSAISYVPRNTCGAGESANSSFMWKKQQGGGSYAAFGLNHDLVKISDLESGTLAVPTAPTDF